MALNKGDIFESFDEFEVKLKAFQASSNVLFSRKSSKKVVCINHRLQTSGRENLNRCLEIMSSARDRHEQNLELARCKTDPASFSLRTLRPIRRGQALLVWYEEGLAREMGVPILTPANIKGHQEYTCTRCQAVYTQPNVLKAHLLLECNQSETAVHELTLTPFSTLLEKIKVRSRARTLGSIDNKEHLCPKRPTSSRMETDDDNIIITQRPFPTETQYHQCCNEHLSPSSSFTSSMSSLDDATDGDNGQDDDYVDASRMTSDAAEAKAKEQSKTRVGSSISSGHYDTRAAHQSTLPSPTSSMFHDVRRKATVEDRFMTPDSSTEQQLTPSKLLESEHAVTLTESQNSLVPPSLAYHPWARAGSQRMGVPSSSVLPFAISYNALPMCYPIHHAPATVHPLHLHYMTYGGRLPATGNIHQFNPCFESNFHASELTPLFHNKRSSSMMSSPSQPQIPQTIPLPPAHPPSTQERELNVIISPSPPPSLQANKDFLSQPRTSPGTQYTFSLPSDKEPLDFLPQAFLANKSKRGHLCLYCGKLYSRKYGLKIHMRTHNGYKPLKCKICSRPFGDPSNLNKHVRLHAQGETPYRCEYCGKVLVRRRDLERHVRSRHPMNSVPDDDVSPVIHSSPCSSPIIGVVDGPGGTTAQVS